MTIERVFVAGAGLMGHGIAQVHAAIGKDVTLYEPDLARAEAGRDRIAGNLERAVAKGRLDRGRARRDARPGRRRPTTSAAAADGRPRRSRPSSRTSTSSAALWRELDERRPAAARSSPRTRARSRSAGWPRPSRAERRDAVRRDALLQPGAGHAAGRADPLAATPRDATVEAIRGLSADARQAGHRVGRPAGVHRQPHPHAVPRRGDARLRGGRRHGRGHRHRRPDRAQPPDGPARAGRLHRPRRLPRLMRVLDDGLGAEHVHPPRVLEDLVDGRAPRPEDRAAASTRTRGTPIAPPK